MLVLPGYTVTRALLRGRINVVYRAIRDSDGRAVIIKTHAQENPGARVLGALRHEHGILRDLDLPGVTRALGLERREHGLALILDDIHAPALTELLASRKLHLTEALRIALLLTETLAALHARGIVHKDIEPGNVLVSPDLSAVHLVDFGVATRISHETAFTASPEALEGTLGYMSPEQTGRMNRTVDHRSDLYSLGCVLYEMLTRERPFTPTDPMELVYSHVAKRPTPPEERAPALPPVVSAITMKLLAKAAEDRYQTAAGLAADLQACLDQLDEKGTIDDFPLGRHDHTTTLKIPHKIYGRNEQKAALFAAFERAATGGAELVLVAGSAGIGKSALVRELVGPLARRGGHLAEGKFEQRSRSVPYSSITEALRRLLQALLAERSEVLARARARIASALGANASVLGELIPEIDLLIGPSSRAPELGPAEARNRFHLVVRRFVRALGQPGQPLVLFLDDLQWADSASLELLRLIVTDPERGDLLIIGAYRDNEVMPTHPLSTAIDALHQGGVPITELSLGPLELEDVVALLAGALGGRADDVVPLARLLHDKTHSNPFFVHQFLSVLAEERLLVFDTRVGAWRYDIEAIAARDVTDNVVDFMVDRIGLLPKETQEALRLSSAIGHAFDLHTLATILEMPPAHAARALWPALRQGLVLPVDGSFSYAHHEEEDDDDPVDSQSSFEASYRFLHDRVQQAAYSTIGQEERRTVHLRIGRLLLSATPQQALDERLFEVVDHLSYGALLITDPAERSRLAEFELLAGGRAKAGAAYEQAADYFRTGLTMLGEDAWETAYPLAFGLIVGAAESEYLCGRFEEADARFQEAQRRARDDLDLTTIRRLRLRLYQVAGHYAEGLEIGLAALEPFGIRFPDDDEAIALAVQEELRVIGEAMAGRTIASLEHAPKLRDPRVVAAINLLADIAPCAYIGRPPVFPLVAMRMVSLSLRHGGNTEASCYAYSVYALMLVSVLGDIEAGYQFSEMSLRLNDRFGTLRLRGTLLHLHGDHIQFWKRSFAAGLPTLDRAFTACLEAGDLVYASYLAFETVWQRYEKGDVLEDVLLASERFAAFALKIKSEPVFDTICLEQQFFSRLREPSPPDGPLLGSNLFDVDACLERLTKASFGCGIAFYHVMRLILHYTEGRPEEALAAAEDARAVEGAMMAMPIEATYHLFRGLSLFACAEARSGEARREMLMTADHEVDKLGLWALHAPDNFEHGHHLLCAERARSEGDEAGAADLYERAIEAARRGGLLHREALASQRAGEHALSRGRRRLAALHLGAAHDLYRQWGADGLAAKLCERFPDLALGAGVDDFGLEEPTSYVPEGSTTDALFDVTTVLRTTEAIAGEIVLDRALERVMHAVLLSSGARRSALLIARGHDIELAASMTVDPDEVCVGTRTPIAECDELARSVVQYVTRTRSALVVGDASSDPRFAADPYIEARSPRSLLCLPLEHQGRLSGVLYLENDVITDAFTARRIALLRMLCNQIAITIENALLYANVKGATDELAAANERLEREVARRTTELSLANEQLSRELEGRALAERARAELQEQVIASQRARLRELSTPLMPITAAIAVMPLVGMVDADRAREVTATALAAASARGARVVILDVTGVPDVGGEVARTLVDTAAALRLVGADAILTGLSSGAARTLVGMGASLSGLVTRSTLQSGIAHALARTGEARGLASRH
jgi:predicted ATPase/anti-anti-sigma regulatory factor